MIMSSFRERVFSKQKNMYHVRASQAQIKSYQFDLLHTQWGWFFFSLIFADEAKQEGPLKCKEVG